MACLGFLCAPHHTTVLPPAMGHPRDRGVCGILWPAFLSSLLGFSQVPVSKPVFFLVKNDLAYILLKKNTFLYII